MVMIEQSRLVESQGSTARVVISTRGVVAGQNIMRRASSLQQGQVVLRAGTEIRPVEIGILAEVGRSHVMAVGRPTLAVLPTGNELVPPDQKPGAGQIRNSNGALLVAAAQGAGAQATCLEIARDDAAHLRELVAQGLEADVLVISGGVSAGVLDLVPAVLAELGVKQVFHKVQIKPGKPLWFGTLAAPGGERLVFGLPGNPVSSFVCFELFVRPAIGRLSGRESASLVEIAAELTIDHLHRGERPTYQPSRLTSVAGRWRIEPLRWHGSGDLRALVDATALACFAAGDRLYHVGETVRALVLPAAR
jgi:molybdopterin molybdotransferase